MSSDEVAQRLHAKATRGELLSVEEQLLLDKWYARQDQEEAALLARTASARSIATLQAQTDAAVAQLVTTTQRLQVLTAENEAARREVADLKRQLAQNRAAQPA
jgi:chromosome segregation ATPase